MERTHAAIAAVVVATVVMLTGCLAGDVRYLAFDELGGRNNGTAGSVKAQDMILNYLEAWTEGPNPAGTGQRRLQAGVSASGGTNLLGVIPGSDLADEYVMVGAHYDHLGDLPHGGPTDNICNGATDNAAGAARRARTSSR